MLRLLRPALLSTALAAAALTAPAAASAQSTDEVIQQPISFTVKNTNRTRLPCATDGRTYTIKGHLVGTAQQLEAADAATLYLHGLGLGEFFWRFTAVPGFNFAENMARRGHVSVTIDRLGYVSSGKAPGTRSCIGGQADIAHQIIGQLKSGGYTGTRSPGFDDVGLVGHSAGGLITQVEGASFSDAKALGVLAYADQGKSGFQRNAGEEAATTCFLGGIRGGTGSGPRGYAKLGETPFAARLAFFDSAPAGVVAAALPLATRNPCGDLASYTAAPPVSSRILSRVRAPVLLVQGNEDALFTSPAVEVQQRRFTNAAGVTFRALPDTGHALTLEASHLELEEAVSGFLRRNGL